MKNIKNNEIVRHIVWIIVIYFFAHCFLLVASGRWWDDWYYADKVFDILLEDMRESSVPWQAYLDASVWPFFDGFYRVIVFLLFGSGAILLYKTLVMIEFLNEEESFWIALLYVVSPVNDARIAWINYPYSWGLFFLFVAFYFSFLWKHLLGKKRIVMRIIAVCFFCLSYGCLESAMIMTYLPLLYYYYLDIKEFSKKQGGKNGLWGTFFVSVKNHIDYLLAPIVWYAADKFFFPGYGKHAGHSSIEWGLLPDIIIKSPRNAMLSFMKVVNSYTSFLKKEWSCVLILIVTIVGLCVNWIIRIKSDNNQKDNREQNYKRDVLLFVVGIVVFYMGFFPYAVRRQSFIQTTHIEGRDAILLGIGMAIILFYGGKVFFADRIRNVIYVVIIVCGVLHFNLKYLDWQEGYYQQLQLREEIANNIEIKENNTFLVIFKNAKISTVYYQTNGNAWAALEEQNRMFLSGAEDLDFLVNDTVDNIEDKKRGMAKAYNYDGSAIDGILFVDYNRNGYATLLEQKINELFNREKFEQFISESKHIKYVSISGVQSDELKQMRIEGTLTNDKVREMYDK